MGVVRALLALIAKPSSWPVIAALMMVGVLLPGALYVNSLKAGNERLRAETAALQESVKDRDAVIAVIEKDRAAYEGRVKAVMGELAKYNAGIVGNAEAALSDYRGIVAPSGDVSVLERQANEGYAKVFRDLNALSR